MEETWYGNLQHDPSLLLSSYVTYEVVYYGSTACKNSGDLADAKRAIREKFGKSITGKMNINCRQIVIKREHMELYCARLYDVSYSVAFPNNLMFCVKEPQDKKFRNEQIFIFFPKYSVFKIFHFEEIIFDTILRFCQLPFFKDISGFRLILSNFRFLKNSNKFKF